MSLTPTAKRRAEQALWECFAIEKTKTEEVSKLKSWLRNNIAGEYTFRTIYETTNSGRKKAIAQFIRIQRTNDVVKFKLAWA